MRPPELIALLALLAATPASARHFQVDPLQPDDTGDGIGQPVKTIAHAIRLAQPGDTIDLATATYHESAEFGNKQGEPGQPIILEGHGSTLDGSEPAQDWEQVSPGLWRKVKLIPKMDELRWYLLQDGRMNHMGRTSKGTRGPLKKPEELQPDEWTYVAAEDAVYLRLPAGRTLEQANVRYPARANGVSMGGHAAHLVIREVTSTHVLNDGFNVHGDVRDARFEHIRSVECGDDGFSAHETSECEIDGFESIGNSTGFTDIGASVTHYRRVQVRACLGFDFMFQGNGEHSVHDAVILAEAQTAFSLGGGDANNPGPCRLQMENVIMVADQHQSQLRLGTNGQLEARSCSLRGIDVHVSGGSAWFVDCAIVGPPRPALQIVKGGQWRGRKNVYAWTGVLVETKTLKPGEMAAWQALTHSDDDSEWSETPSTKGIGANSARLRDLGLLER